MEEDSRMSTLITMFKVSQANHWSSSANSYFVTKIWITDSILAGAFNKGPDFLLMRHSGGSSLMVRVFIMFVYWVAWERAIKRLAIGVNYWATVCHWAMWQLHYSMVK